MGARHTIITNHSLHFHVTHSRIQIPKHTHYLITLKTSNQLTQIKPKPLTFLFHPFRPRPIRTYNHILTLTNIHPHIHQSRRDFLLFSHTPLPFFTHNYTHSLLPSQNSSPPFLSTSSHSVPTHPIPSPQTFSPHIHAWQGHLDPAHSGTLFSLSF